MLVWILILFAMVAPAVAAAERVALVIGIDDYDRMPDLRNAANDAEAMAGKLEELGFQVIGGDAQINVTHDEFKDLVKRFTESAGSDDVAFFYFAGHGIGHAGANYLIPGDDGALEYTEDLADRAINARTVLERMGANRAGVNIMILDACRDEALSDRTRSSSTRGLVAMAPQVGSTRSSETFIGYAASYGQKSFDGEGENGVFTEQFVRLLDQPGLTLDDMFTRLTGEVEAATQGRQTPMRESTMKSLLQLAGHATVASSPANETAAEGQLHIQVSPASASVRVDGVLLGTGSRTITEAAGTTVVVRAEADGHEPREERVRVQRGQVADVVLRLEPSRAASEPATVMGLVAMAGQRLQDPETGLVWMANDNGRDINAIDAEAHCKGQGMRLPTGAELASIHGHRYARDTACGLGAALCKAHPLFKLTGAAYWTSEDANDNEAWIFWFITGQQTRIGYSADYQLRALCVAES